MAVHRTEELVAVLRRQIVEGEIVPGEKLPSENELMAAHAVSRTVVREAVTRLRADGLVRTRRGAGSFALTPPTEPGSGWPSRPVRTLADRRALLELRTGVECEAAALAAARRTPEDLAALREATDRFATDGGSPAAALERDFAFHRGVAAAAANPFLLELIDGLGPTMIAMPRPRLAAAPGADAADAATDPVAAVDLAAVDPAATASAAAEHAAVLEAIEAGDGRAAAAAMRVHLAGSWRRLADG